MVLLDLAPVALEGPGGEPAGHEGEKGQQGQAARHHPRIAALEADTSFRFIEGDASDPALLRAALPRAGFVFHLAAPVGLHRVLATPDRVITEGVVGMDRLLDAAAEAEAHVLLTSSSEVYGKKARVPFAEDDSLEPGPPTYGRWGYALMKASLEAMALARHRRGEVRAVVARLFNVVGPRQTGRYGMVLPRFIRRATAGEPLIVHGDGRQTRTFLHVADAVDALLALAREGDAAGEVFNVGGSEEISMHALAERVIEATGSASPIRLLPYVDAYPEGYEDVPRRCPDVTKLTQLTGWRPRRSFPWTTVEVV